MKYPVAAAAALLCTSLLAQAAAPNTMQVVVTGGPHAGTYAPPGTETICMRVKGKQFSVGYRNMSAHDAKMLSEAGLQIDNPDDAGAKRGNVRIAFGDPDKSPTVYAIDVPHDGPGPLTLTTGASSADVAFQGKTKDGIAVRITVHCLDIERL